MSSRALRTVLSILLIAVAARAADPAPFKFSRSAPEAQGVSSAALLRAIEEGERKIDALHSLMVIRHGQAILEGWWAPYAAEVPHEMYSLSKSFTSTAVGLAVADGKLNVTDTVLSFFPDLAPAQPSANLRAMRVRDLLTMSTGHHNEDIANFPYVADEDPVKKFLALPVAHKPGTFFVYNTPATFMLSAIVQKVTGQSVRDYLRPRLFEPLGIVDPAWDATRQGVSLGGFGLHLRTEDIARFGQLYLQKGEWRGQQLVPAAWVEAATSRQMSNGSNPASDWDQGYGYQFWRCRNGIIRGDGAHGQFCVVLPQHDTVVAITAGTRDLQGVLNFLWEHLVPALQTAPLPADAAAHTKLTAKLASLTLAAPTGTATAEMAKTLAGKKFVLANAPEGLRSLTILPPGTNGDTIVAADIGGTEQRITVGAGAWRKSTVAAGAVPIDIAAAGAWTGAESFSFKVARYRTPFVTAYRLRFAGDTLEMEIEQNVGPANQRITRVTGKVE